MNSRIKPEEETMIIRRALAGLAGLGLTAALSLAALPAQAVTQAAACNDGGGIRYDASVDWNYRYEATGDVIRASVSNLRIERLDSEIRADDAGFDVRIRVYSTNTKIQDKFFDGYDPAATADAQLTAGVQPAHFAVFNPANPVSNGDRVGIADGYSKVVLTIGTDSDGLGDCSITFRQPDGLPFNPAV